jgi:hypothetical protein
MNASAYNDSRHWADAGIFKAPLFDAPSFQKRIDRIVGVSPSGHSIVKLLWAWDARKWENTAWDEFGNATSGEWRQKYRALTIDIGNDDYVDISPPRWILEERYEPQAIAESWELTRYRMKVVEPVPIICRYCKSPGRFYSVEELISIFAKWDAGQVQDGKVFVHWVDTDRSEGHILACRFCNMDTELRTVREDVWGPVPREGWYNLLPHIGIIADHANHCCKRAADEHGEICYGTYKEPDGRELKRLKKAISARNKEVETNPHIRPELDTAALEQAKHWGLQMMADREVRRRGELAEIRRAHRFNNNIVYSI